MIDFIKRVLTDSDGNPSSKRIVMFALTILFIAAFIYNMTTGKTPAQVFTDQLFTLLLYIFSVVFGEKVVNIFKKPEEPKE